MALIDLHLHSSVSSDGQHAPAAIASLCAEAGLRLFSLTDHNSTRGVAEAAAKGCELGLRMIPGIEIDCNFRGTDLHLLGYGINHLSPDFDRLERGVAKGVMESFDQMIINLCRLGFEVDAQAVLAAAGEGLPTGELIAEVMLSDPQYHTRQLAPYMEGGARGDMPYINFYLDYFAQGRPAYVEVAYCAFREAVELIRDNGGVPIVAHAGHNLRGRERVVEALLDCGAAGLEVFNNYHTAEQSAYFRSEVERRDALMTCGSDFHGKTKPLISVGQIPLDAACEARLLSFANHVKVVGREGV